MRRLIAIAGFALCVAASPATAHHSLAPYIRTAADAVVGTVKEFAWTNPHTRLVVMVQDAGGMDVEWSFEGVGTSRLASAGFKKDMIVPGDLISVTYNPRRDKAVGGMFVAVTLSDGTVLRLNRYQQLQGGGQRLE